MCVSGFSLVEESARRGNEEVEKEILDREVFKASANDSRSATYAREGSRVVYVRAFLKPVLYWTDAGNVEPTNTVTVILDNTRPSVAIVNPPDGRALQDGVTFIISAIDAGSGVSSLNFSIREANGGEGTHVGFEDLSATYNVTTGKWTLFFDTLQLPDGYYVVLVKAKDNLGNIGSITVPYSIRNWAVIELLPASDTNKAGRTMPVKFALRVAAEVDPDQPFVYNEELGVEIYATDNPAEILQESYFGDTAKDYRISSVLYITNFKTSKSPTEYTVAIYRDNFDVGSFTFETTK